MSSSIQQKNENIYIIKMVQFLYWYAYFDSIFLKKYPTCNKTLSTIIGKQGQQWSRETILPQLLCCFQELEAWILEEKNWSQSICTIDELNKIEADVTNVLQLLEIQKMYIKKFWGNFRRIQASVAHLYAILQIFISSIIPYNTMTLFQCKAANKLCVRIANLQELIKSLMKKMNAICSFFSSQFFNEEFEILKNFFENFVAYMKSIPKIKKARMFHVSQLLKYVILVNTIEITSFQQNHRQNFLDKDSKRRVSQAALSITSRLRTKSMEKISKNSYTTFNGYILYREKRKQNSCPQSQNFKQNLEEQKPKRELRFIFPTWIRRHSIKHRKQSIPKLHFEHSFKGKSNTQTQKPLPSPSPRKYRNKSATKASLSKSRQQTFSPLRIQCIKQSFNLDKIVNQQNILGEQQQNCAIVEKEQTQKTNINLPQEDLLSLESMSIVKNKRKFEDFVVEYKIMKELKDILNE